MWPFAIPVQPLMWVCDHCEVGWAGDPNCWMCGRSGRQSTWWTFQYKRCGAGAS